MLLLLACAPDAIDSDIAVVVPEPAPLAPLTSGECPDFSGSGSSTLMSNGVEREVMMLFPDDVRPGLPVLFAWHPLGGSATYMERALDLSGFARDNDVIVVVPEAMDTNLLEWEFRTDGADDLALFDDVRTCLSQELEVDLARFYTSGFSAGALWSTFLAVHRGDTLASVLLFSGGTDPVVTYLSSEGEKYPTLLLWGGDTDLWGNDMFHVDFSDTTSAYAGELRADGHFVVMCDHGGGHTIPSYGRDLMATWLLSHRYGEASPWIGAEATELNPDCFVPE